MPLFAHANAGVSVSGGSMEAPSWTILTRVAVGLVLGKPIGVLLVSWLMLRLRIGTLPTGVGASHLVVLGLVAGVGFTMALFVSQLAFSNVAFGGEARHDFPRPGRVVLEPWKDGFSLGADPPASKGPDHEFGSQPSSHYVLRITSRVTAGVGRGPVRVAPLRQWRIAQQPSLRPEVRGRDFR
jgi:hypothetical protein